ncbi:hypothetical protein PR048_026206 [Dryococelus australis]|uniref:PiggyBac transposable element-derived protein 4 C-terminal zinc-ribbon domain-containing protein n=1 Tax=Dryococelus australis TaxID=614101 RepID=A0ABQ9GKP3_9NEOP|nr:hypothetical protein PR048_026206 [Dryococelus australis]
MEIIDLAALKVYILWRKNNPDWHKNNSRKRRCFLHELMLMLAKPHIEERSQTPVSFQNNIVSAIEAVGIPVTKTLQTEEGTVPETSKMETGRRCTLCLRNKDRRTPLMCMFCKTPVCQINRKEQLVTKCVNCE